VTDPRDDQFHAAIQDAAARVTSAHQRRRKGYSKLTTTTTPPPAVLELFRRYDAVTDGEIEGVAMRVCPHLAKTTAAVAHWLAWAPLYLACERCAGRVQAAAAAALQESGEAALPASCDLCGQRPDRGIGMVEVARGPVIAHAALCDDCYPEGADTPRSGS
jgi:hypothetical protein